MDDERSPDLTEHRNNVLHYILNNSVNKYPIKHSDIISRALNGNAKIFNLVLDTVKNALDNSYGMLLRSVPDSKTGKQLICSSKFPAISNAEFDDTQSSQVALLFLVVSYIYMKGIPVPEESIEEFLKGLMIYFDRPHPYFGPNIKKLITETFVKQLYIKKVKSDMDSVENRLFYSLGYRSEVEFPQMEILETVSKLLNKPAKHFVLQFTQANANDTSIQ